MNFAFDVPPAPLWSLKGGLMVVPRLAAAQTSEPRHGPLEDSDGHRLLTTPEAAARLGLSPRTLEGLRRKGGGPVFKALSRNAVRYSTADLDAWVASRTAPHTAKSRQLLA